MTATPIASTGRSSSTRCGRWMTASSRSSTRSGAAAAPQHLHHLHLRQRLFLRRAPPDRRQVPRLRARDPPALPDPGPGHQARLLDRRAGGEHRHRPDGARTGRRRSGQEHRRPLAGPLLHDPELRTRRPILFESFVETNDVEANGEIADSGAGEAAGRRRKPSASIARAAQGLRGDPPRPLQVHRLAGRREGALRHQPSDPDELNNIVRDPTTSRSATSSTGNCDRPRGLRRQDAASEAATEIPLTRKESRRQRKQEKEEKRTWGSGKNGNAGLAGRGSRRQHPLAASTTR